MAKATVKETALMAVSDVMPNHASTGSKRCATAGSPIHPRPMDANVMPSCVALRYASRWRMMLIATFACHCPLFASSAILVERTLTMANSAATKNPLSSTSRNAAMIKPICCHMLRSRILAVFSVVHP